MNFYLTIMFVFAFCALCSYDRGYMKLCGNSINLFLFGILLILLAGFRYGIETDYWSYARIFKSSKNPGIEPFFYWIINFTKYFLADNYNVFVFVLAIISIPVKLLFFSKLKHPLTAVFIYLCFFYIMCEWNTVRQGISVSFLLWSSKYVKERKLLPFFILVVLATGFHISSIMFLPVYFLCTGSISVRKVAVYSICFLVLKYFLFGFIRIQLISFSASFLDSTLSEFTQRLLVYLNDDSAGIITIGFLRRIMILLAFIILNNKRIFINVYFNIYFTGFLIYVLFMGNTVLSSRISLAFEFFMIPLFADMNIKVTRKNMYILLCLFALSCMIFIYTLMSGNAVPYRTYLML